MAARTADLQASRDQARAGDRAKTAFLAVASHELRTPLNAIVGYAEMVRDGLQDEDPEVLARDLDHVLAAASVLTQHVDRMLAMANLEAGHQEVHLSDIALHELLLGVARRQHRLLQAGGKRIEVHVPQPFVFRSDADLLQGLLDELAQNAVKFTPEGRIQLRGLLMPEDVVIEVEDEGAGIPPEVLARIFEPFGQQDDSTTRRREGLGLGLTLCQRYAGLLGGVLEVVPAPATGSVFRVILPRHR